MPEYGPAIDDALPLLYRGAVYRGGDEPDGTVYLVAGSLRLRVHGDSVDWPHDFTLHTIVAHARDGQRFYFATADGALFRADGFTGALTRIGETNGRELTSGFDSAGSLSALARDGTLWLGGPDDQFRPAPAPANGPLVDSGFADRAFGVAVTAPGLLFRTTDGGAHFEPVDTGRDAVSVVYPNTDAFVLATTGGLFRVGPTGPAVPFVGSTGVLDHELTADTLRTVRTSFLADFALTPQILLARGGIELAGGRVAVIDGDDVFVYDPSGMSARIDLPPHAVGMDRAPRCRLSPFGAQIFVRCVDADSAIGLYTSDGQRPFTALRRAPPDAAVLTSPEGETVVVGADCDEGTALHDRDMPLCFYDGHSWRTRTIPMHSVLVAVAGDALLYRTFQFGGGDDDTESDDDDLPYRVLHLNGVDEGRPVALDAPDAHLITANFTPTGQIAGLARRGVTRYVALGGPDRPLALRPLPHEVDTIAFADAMHGVATGQTLGQVFVTNDGARTWSPLVLPIDGDASSVPVGSRDDEEGDPDAVFCTRSECIVGGRLLWSAQAVTGYRTFAARRAPTVEPVALLSDSYTAGRWICASARGESDRRASLTGALPASLPADRLYGSDGWVEPHLSQPRDRTSGRFAFAWGGVDDRGRFQANGRAGDVPSAPVLPNANTDEARLVPVAVTRALALVARCAPVAFPPASVVRCADLVVATRNAPPRALPPLARMLDPDAYQSVSNAEAFAMPEVRSSMALPDGGVAVHLTLRALYRVPRPGQSDAIAMRDTVDALFVLDARGNVIARRGYAWDRRTYPRMLARGPHGVGLAATSLSAPRTLTFYGLDPRDEGQTLGQFPAGQLDLCNGPPEGTSGSTRVNARVPGFAPTVSVSRFELAATDNLLPVLEFRSDADACLRGASFWPADPDGAERDILTYTRGALRVRAVSGELRGVAVDRERDTALSCRRP